MNSPFAFWKLFESSAQSGSANVTISQAINSSTPARATHASRETRAAGTFAGLAAMTLMRSSVLREQAQRFRRQRDGQALSLHDGEVAHRIGGEVRKDRNSRR